MKILIVRSFAQIVNLKTYNLQEIGMAKGLVKQGHICDIVYYNGKNKDKEQVLTFEDNVCVKVFWLRGYSIFRDGIMPSLKKLVSQYDKIIFDSYNAITSLWAIKKIPAKCIIYQGPYPSKYTKNYVRKTKIIDKLFYSFIDKNSIHIMTKSGLAKDFLTQKGFTNIDVVGVGLNTDSLTNGNIDRKKMDEIISVIEKFKNNGILGLYIGVLEERRNILFMLDCMKELKRIAPYYKLLIIGKGSDEYERKCQEYIVNKGLEKNVLLIKKVEQAYLKCVYNRADFFLFPTQYEIYGMVLLEAMYFGLPVFTTYNGGSSTMITDSNGIILKNEDALIWAKKINLIINNAEKRRNISMEAHRTIEKNFTWEVMTKHIIEVLKQM
ncbi:glycosyltransferase family 4 protein [Clostridium sp. Marseille-P299]|uniref:glycosyltransferase family 4 protein n=1 Tax=Clostridium sp. Marseille-P299 TaxID=1805477 RepID=UPI0008367764|nr:glycosyltransferase family 4 protein [Clostridium sp. Marseille-P299]